jgi:hypothetical protein
MQSSLQNDCIHILKLNNQTTCVFFRIRARIRLLACKYKKTCYMLSLFLTG